MLSDQGHSALVGPVIAENEEAARILARSMFDAAGVPVRIDVPAEQTSFRQWLEELGFVETAVRAEMARGAPRLPWQVPQRFALAAQAWG